MVMTRPLAQTLDMAISNGVSGITRRWSMVPCSRSRTRSRPRENDCQHGHRIDDRHDAGNHEVVMFGLNTIRTAKFTV